MKPSFLKKHEKKETKKGEKKESPFFEKKEKKAGVEMPFKKGGRVGCTGKK